MQTPILFIIFNRPDVTAQVFAAIRDARPSKLYIAADGYRQDKEGEKDLVLRARQVVTEAIDWDCEVSTLFRETNLGCRKAVTSALDWFFSQEKEGIILEDDCLPDPSFFQYCQELLECYRHDSRVMCITGDNFQHGFVRGKYSYYFSQVPHCWGWASWSRAWAMNRSAIESFEEIIAEPTYTEFTHNNIANAGWRDLFLNTYEGRIDTWDFLWVFANFVNHGLTVLPQKNLVKNLGLGHHNATHTKRKDRFSSVESEKMEFPLRHPPYMCLHKAADDFLYAETFKPKKRMFLKSKSPRRFYGKLKKRVSAFFKSYVF